ncbi:MAG: hypothetical protein Q8L24_02350 [bacterium]|nr:hypothetical protein [bacterium]
MWKHVVKNLIVLAISIGAAILLSRLGVFDLVLEFSGGLKVAGIFIAGLFYTSILTMAPAAVVLGEFATSVPPFFIALIGALGSVVGDSILLFVVKKEEADVDQVFKYYRLSRLRNFYHLRSVRIGMGIAGFMVIASPLPDELGLALMGASGIKRPLFFMISYSANFVGILAVTTIIHSLL